MCNAKNKPFLIFEIIFFFLSSFPLLAHIFKKFLHISHQGEETLFSLTIYTTATTNQNFHIINHHSN